MPFLLHLNKLVGEVLDFGRESPNIPMSTPPSRISVFQRPIDLEPRPSLRLELGPPTNVSAQQPAIA